MSIYKSAIHKPITTILVFIGIIIIGLYSYLRLPIDQFPEIDLPVVSIMTTYPGANSSEIETNVTKLLENSLNSVDGLSEMTSESKENLSLVTLEFEWGHNLDEATNDIRSSIDMVYDNLPEGCSRPLVFKLSTSMMPIVMYAVTADESYPGLKQILDDDVVTVLNRVDGIGNISLSGAPERYIYIDIDQNKLDAYNLSLEQIGQAVSTSNLNMASGSMKIGREQYQLRVQGEYVESSEINDVVVSFSKEGKPVFVRDVAIVRDSIKDLTLDEKINSKEGVRLVVMKQSGANTVQVCNDVEAEMEQIMKTLPADVNVDVIFTSADNIKNAISGLSESILYALIFVVLVVWVFLGRWRSAIIIGVTIPISLIVAFVYLDFVDSSINIISLSSLTVAIGMVVDDAIVVLENISKHIDRGSSPKEAAIYATNEVWVSVIVTTMVIAAVFIPLTLLGGQAGLLFKELGWIVTIVVCTSTLVAITLTPMLSSHLLKSKKIKVDENGKLVELTKKKSIYERVVINTLDKADYAYSKALDWTLHHKLLSGLFIICLFVVSLLPALLGYIGADFMPQQDNGRIKASIELQRGTRVEESVKTARKLETAIYKRFPELEIVTSTTGSNDNAGFTALFNKTANNIITMNFVAVSKSKRERSIFEIAEIIRQELDQFPEIVEYQVEPSSGMGNNGASSLDIEVYGYDFDQTNLLADSIRFLMETMPDARDVHVTREEDQAELQIKFDKEKLARHGLSSQMVSSYVRNRINGMSAGYLKEFGEEYDIVVRLEEKYRNNILDLNDMTINCPTGEKVKLSELGTISEYWSPPEISRKNRQRIVTIEVTPEGTSLSELATEAAEKLAHLNIPAGLHLNIGGDYEDQQETFSDMGLLAALIMALVYIVMASQFESFAKPFIIMLAIPFAISGAILALWITGTSLDVIGALGIVLLIGIVVKNGIVLVDYINLMRDRDYSLNEAITLSGKSRLRPVLMTAFTTVLGMVPMALSTSEGSETWVPMGIVVIGGVTVSTFVTLFVVPIMYAVMSRHGERDKKRKDQEHFVFMNLAED